MTPTSTAPPRELTITEESAARRSLDLISPLVRREIRDAARVSLRRMARELQVSHGAIAYYERGSNPREPALVVRYRELLEDLATVAGYPLPNTSAAQK